HGVRDPVYRSLATTRRVQPVRPAALPGLAGVPGQPVPAVRPGDRRGAGRYPASPRPAHRRRTRTAPGPHSRAARDLIAWWHHPGVRARGPVALADDFAGLASRGRRRTSTPGFYPGMVAARSADLAARRGDDRAHRVFPRPACVLHVARRG